MRLLATPTGPLRASWVAMVALCVLAAGCAADPTRAKFDSHSTFDRTFDTVVDAMADQKLVIGRKDRQGGIVVGTETGVTITAMLLPQVDSVIQVRFEQTGTSPTGPAVLKKVAESYETRMSRLKVLGTFTSP